MLSWCSVLPKSFKPDESLNVEVLSLVTTHMNWGLNQIIQNANPDVKLCQVASAVHFCTDISFGSSCS